MQCKIVATFERKHRLIYNPETVEDPLVLRINRDEFEKNYRADFETMLETLALQQLLRRFEPRSLKKSLFNLYAEALNNSYDSCYSFYKLFKRPQEFLGKINLHSSFDPNTSELKLRITDNGAGIRAESTRAKRNDSNYFGEKGKGLLLSRRLMDEYLEQPHHHYRFRVFNHGAANVFVIN